MFPLYFMLVFCILQEKQELPLLAIFVCLKKWLSHTLWNQLEIDFAVLWTEYI